MESEFIALDKAGKEAERFQNFLEDIPYWPKPVTPVCIHCDSQATIGRTESMMYNDSAHPNILWELTSSSSHALQIPREDTPLLTDTRHLSSSFKTFTNVFIAVVVAGVLGLPYSFKKIGWLMGTVMLLLVASLTYHCMMLWCIILGKSLNPIIKLPRFHLLGDLGYADAMIVLSQAGF
ncbi:hypothetical protein T459_13544 [Capsicum annuum]|uniref:Amino acid transporter transmembrane domain-containing protein n=1 Tax=Capsicum annuum TaxID=4072 RepID=A0A2G2ZT07_CAPAN|nr:hypothetical protein T459_13544 [Capsicum annuum]